MKQILKSAREFFMAKPDADSELNLVCQLEDSVQKREIITKKQSCIKDFFVM